MPQGRPMPGEVYRHFKNKDYQVITVATHTETGETYVVYQALYGAYHTYLRPYDMFISEVDHVKYPDVQQQYRFAYLGSSVTDMETDAALAGKETYPDSVPEGIDPRFLAFLDADYFEEKYKIVTEMEEELDNHLINQMAASIDVIIEDGETEDRVRELKKCIRMRARFEAGRR